MRISNFVLCVCLSGIASWASPQTLGELAAKEKAKRKGQKPAKTYTESDLGHSTRGTFSVTGAEPTPSPSASPGETGNKGDQKPEKSDIEKRQDKQKELQKRLDDQVAQAKRIQNAIEDAQRELNDVANMTFGDRRAALTKLVEDGKAKMAEIEQEIKNIEEEARRAGLSVKR